MSVKTDAETIQDLAGKIVGFEILKLQFVANGGKIEAIHGDPESAVTLTPAQRQAILAVEDGWKQTVKNLSAAW